MTPDADTPMPARGTATGTNTRVQMHRENDSFTPHGSVRSYDPDTGVLVVHFDFQARAEEAYTMTPQSQGKYTDQASRVWLLVR